MEESCAIIIGPHELIRRPQVGNELESSPHLEIGRGQDSGDGIGAGRNSDEIRVWFNGRLENKRMSYASGRVARSRCVNYHENIRAPHGKPRHQVGVKESGINRVSGGDV